MRPSPQAGNDSFSGLGHAAPRCRHDPRHPVKVSVRDVDIRAAGGDKGPGEVGPLLALVTALGFAVAGCGSGKKAASPSATLAITPGSITIIGEEATIADVKAGTRIACKSLPGIRVTVPATGASVIARGRGRELRLKRLPHGVIRVFCPSLH
jgi:hypothetical protein